MVINDCPGVGEVSQRAHPRVQGKHTALVQVQGEAHSYGSIEGEAQWSASPALPVVTSLQSGPGSISL